MKETPVIFRYVRPLLAIIINLAGFGFLFLITFQPIPIVNKELVGQAQGYTLALLGIVNAYYFGTSKDKSDTEQASRTPNTTTTQQTTVEEIK